MSVESFQQKYENFFLFDINHIEKSSYICGVDSRTKAFGTEGVIDRHKIIRRYLRFVLDVQKFGRFRIIVNSKAAVMPIVYVNNATVS